MKAAEEMIPEFILVPDESLLLYDMIGKTILDIGYFNQAHEKDESKELNKKWVKHLYEKEFENNPPQSSAISNCIDPIVLVLEDRNVAFFRLKNRYPYLEVHSNLTLEKMIELQPTFGFHFFSVNQDPDMADDVVKEMIGKKIIGIDLIRVTDSEEYDLSDYRYCILKLYLEGNMIRLLGTEFTVMTVGVSIRYENEMPIDRVEKVIPIRKKGFMK